MLFVIFNLAMIFITALIFTITLKEPLTFFVVVALMAKSYLMLYKLIDYIFKNK